MYIIFLQSFNWTEIPELILRSDKSFGRYSTKKVKDVVRDSGIRINFLITYATFTE